PGALPRRHDDAVGARAHGARPRPRPSRSGRRGRPHAGRHRVPRLTDPLLGPPQAARRARELRGHDRAARLLARALPRTRPPALGGRWLRSSLAHLLRRLAWTGGLGPVGPRVEPVAAAALQTAGVAHSL